MCDNKLKIIDYIIILKLLIKKINVEFPNNFYQEWVSYLIPYIDLNSYQKKNKFTYYDNDLACRLISKYNLKDKLFKVFDKNYKDNNISKTFINNNYINNDITYTFEYRKDLLEQKKLIILKISFISKYCGTIIDRVIDSYLFEIPEECLYLLDSQKLSYNEFNNKMIKLWEDNQGMIMLDYIFAKPMKKLIYFDMFKKILFRIIGQQQSNKMVLQ